MPSPSRSLRSRADLLWTDPADRIFRSRTIRPSSIGRDRTWALSIVRRFSLRRRAAGDRRGYIAQLNEAHAFPRPIVTRVEPLTASIRRRAIIRITWSTIPGRPTSPSTICRRWMSSSASSRRFRRPPGAGGVALISSIEAGTPTGSTGQALEVRSCSRSCARVPDPSASSRSNLPGCGLSRSSTPSSRPILDQGHHDLRARSGVARDVSRKLLDIGYHQSLAALGGGAAHALAEGNAHAGSLPGRFRGPARCLGGNKIPPS